MLPFLYNVHNIIRHCPRRYTEELDHLDSSLGRNSSSCSLSLNMLSFLVGSFGIPCIEYWLVDAL